MSFRREKYVPAGGPDGGDGGRGGEVRVVADSTDMSLEAFRDRRRFAAENGGAGARNKRTGPNGAALTLHVPAGTVIREGERMIADLDRPGAAAVVAAGGRGGRGNARFATSTRQAPRAGELGEPGEQRNIHLELRLIADIGVVGLPNSGKSTLLARLTGAHPKIAAYPFTTLHPNLGVAELDRGRTLVIADVPGLIEGAHHGAGLGLGFLRHLERTRCLVHLVDAAAGVDAAVAALDTVNAELAEYSGELARRPALLAFNKIDLPDAGETARELAAAHPGAMCISAQSGEGCDALLAGAARIVEAARTAEPEPAVTSGIHRVYQRRPRLLETPEVSRDAEGYRVAGAGVVRMVEMTDLDNDEAVARLQRRLGAAGVDAALAAAGCVEGDTVRIGEAEFVYTEAGLGG